MFIVTEIPSPLEPSECIRFLSMLADFYARWVKHNPLPPLMMPKGNRAHPNCKIRYQEEPNSGKGFEQWDSPWTVVARGWGDCDDLILYRLCELRAKGERAGVSLIKKGDRFHAQVKRKNGDYEDPSTALIQKAKGH